MNPIYAAHQKLRRQLKAAEEALELAQAFVRLRASDAWKPVADRIGKLAETKQDALVGDEHNAMEFRELRAEIRMLRFFLGFGCASPEELSALESQARHLRSTVKAREDRNFHIDPAVKPTEPVDRQGVAS